MGRALRTLAALVVAGCLLLPGGCGSGLTGGSIPPGSGTSRALGIVVKGDAHTVRVPGTTVRFEPLPAAGRADNPAFTGDDGFSLPPGLPPGFSPPPAGGGNTPPFEPPVQDVEGAVQASSNDLGEFVAVGLKAGPTRLVVIPPKGLGLNGTEYRIDLPEDDEYWMILSPIPTNVNLAGLSGIDVEPKKIDLRVGQNVQIVTHLLGGAPPSLVPNYFVRGAAGIVNTSGQFTAVRAGTASLRVAVATYSQDVPVTVAPAQTASGRE